MRSRFPINSVQCQYGLLPPAPPDASVRWAFTTAENTACDLAGGRPDNLDKATMIRARQLLAASRGCRKGCRFASTGKSKFDNVLVERRERVGIITFNRPKALNALNSALMKDICGAAEDFEEDPGIGALVLTGSERAFAAGADIKEMAGFSFAEAYGQDLFKEWARLGKIRKPMIAAVNGYALGGGCEVAMMCDIILAGEKAKFGQPEINLGVIPGWGGTQRLVRAVGKSKAMEMILTGSQVDAHQAEGDGLVAKVYPAEDLVDEAVAMAARIASKSLPVALMAKETVNAAFESTLAEGVRLERRMFHSAFALDDQKEGMAAFAEKREPKWTHK
ncbi:unnamed protein product [Ascophyllum nodosum]